MTFPSYRSRNPGNYIALANCKVPSAPISWLYRTTQFWGPWVEMDEPGIGCCPSRWMGQKFVSSSCAGGWNPGCDTLNLILFAIFNSQNISHLFPVFLTTWLPGLFASTRTDYPEVFSPLWSAKPTKASYQRHRKVANQHCYQFLLRCKHSFLVANPLRMPFTLLGKEGCGGVLNTWSL